MTNARILGHRGAPDPAAGVVENSLRAFSRALGLGADGVELDVRLTADGALAVHHDPAIEGLGSLSALAASELPAHVPLLSDALEALDGAFVNVELKDLPGEPGHDPTGRLAREVAELVAAAGREGDVLVSSFWPPDLEAVRAARPEIATGLLVAGWFDPEKAVGAARARGCCSLHPALSLVTSGLVGEAHAAGLGVAAWTVVDRAGLEAALTAGVDTVITDDVALARAAIAPR